MINAQRILETAKRAKHTMGVAHLQGVLLTKENAAGTKSTYPTQNQNLTSTIGLNATLRFQFLFNSLHVLSLTRRPRGTSNFIFLTTTTSTFAEVRAAPMSSILPESVADTFWKALASTLLFLYAGGFTMMVCWRWRER